MESLDHDLNKYQTLIAEIHTQTNEIKLKHDLSIKKKIDVNKETELGLSFFTVKYQLMLQYLTMLSFYALLKLKGDPLENHPVVLKLIGARTYLEKMKPIELKLKYQIDKLIRSTNIVKSNELKELKTDSLQFKPNPENLISDRKDENKEDTNGKYKAPRIAPMPFNDKPMSSKAHRDEMRLKEKATKSRLLRELMAETDDRPEEHQVIGSLNHLEDAELAERTRYEEENFLRLQTSKRQEKKLRDLAKGSLANELLDLDDLRGANFMANIKDKNTGLLDKIKSKRSFADSSYEAKYASNAEKNTDALFGESKPNKGSNFSKAKSRLKKKLRSKQ